MTPRCLLRSALPFPVSLNTNGPPGTDGICPTPSVPPGNHPYPCGGGLRLRSTPVLGPRLGDPSTQPRRLPSGPPHPVGTPVAQCSQWKENPVLSQRVIPPSSPPLPPPITPSPRRRRKTFGQESKLPRDREWWEPHVPSIEERRGDGGGQSTEVGFHPPPEGTPGFRGVGGGFTKIRTEPTRTLPDWRREGRWGWGVHGTGAQSSHYFRPPSGPPTPPLPVSD